MLESELTMSSNKRILIVDDNVSLAEMYRTYLSDKGYEVKYAGDGENALTITLEYKPDLILLDVMMPKINGFEVLDIIRNTPMTSAIPVIMLTALGAQADKDRAASLGSTAYLEKSVTDLDTLLKKVQSELALS
jgi:CheY-like chemotaxis protein